MTCYAPFGLGGATRADLADEKDDYVAFVLNVGEPRDKDLGGGTFGFGKAVFFTTSSVGTVVVYTSHRLPSGEIESRLIGVALGHSYSDGGRNFTGRHWWGLGTEGGVEPLLNEEADRVAVSLGLPLFDAGDTGTTVAILQPQLDGRTPQEAMHWIASAIGWHLWPKMLSRDEYGGLPEMTFRVACEEEETPVPSPDTHVGLAAFAETHPDVAVFTAAIDERLDAHGYILPGMGDAGESRMTAHQAKKLDMAGLGAFRDLPRLHSADFVITHSSLMFANAFSGPTFVSTL